MCRAAQQVKVLEINEKKKSPIKIKKNNSGSAPLSRFVTNWNGFFLGLCPVVLPKFYVVNHWLLLFLNSYGSIQVLKSNGWMEASLCLRCPHTSCPLSTLRLVLVLIQLQIPLHPSCSLLKSGADLCRASSKRRFMEHLSDVGPALCLS